MSVEDLMRLDQGDILTFDYSVDRPVNLLINNVPKFRGHVIAAGRKKSFQIQDRPPT